MPLKVDHRLDIRVSIYYPKSLKPATAMGVIPLRDATWERDCVAGAANLARAIVDEMKAQGADGKDMIS